jgi:hypothetical protein
MKKTIELASLALASALATTMLLSGYAAEKPTDKPSTDAKKPANTPLPIYDTIEQVKAMPPCKATVEQVETFSSLLSTAGGQKFRIGSERGEQEVWHFVGTLKQGRKNDFPSAFLVFEARKFYPNADDIKAMPPCKVTVVYDAPCFTLFRAADGKMFVIGDPGSKPEVIHFLNTLEKGQTYEFPGNFFDYQKKQVR